MKQRVFINLAPATNRIKKYRNKYSTLNKLMAFDQQFQKNSSNKHSQTTLISKSFLIKENFKKESLSVPKKMIKDIIKVEKQTNRIKKKHKTDLQSQCFRIIKQQKRNKNQNPIQKQLEKTINISRVTNPSNWVANNNIKKVKKQIKSKTLGHEQQDNYFKGQKCITFQDFSEENQSEEQFKPIGQAYLSKRKQKDYDYKVIFKNVFASNKKQEKKPDSRRSNIFQNLKASERSVHNPAAIVAVNNISLISEKRQIHKNQRKKLKMPVKLTITGQKIGQSPINNAYLTHNNII